MNEGASARADVQYRVRRSITCHSAQYHIHPVHDRFDRIEVSCAHHAGAPRDGIGESYSPRQRAAVDVCGTPRGRTFRTRGSSQSSRYVVRNPRQRRVMRSLDCRYEEMRHHFQSRCDGPDRASGQATASGSERWRRPGSADHIHSSHDVVAPGPSRWDSVSKVTSKRAALRDPGLRQGSHRPPRLRPGL
jgi:hypothetical protein